MAKSSTSAPPRKDTYQKPHPDFPLTPHRGTGRWCKKVKGKIHYFGKLEGDEKGRAALDEWLRVKDDLLAGRKPRKKRDGLCMVDAVNAFLTAKRTEVRSGEITQRTWNDYRQTCSRVLDCFGRPRLVEDLASEDFEEFKCVLQVGRNLTTLGNEIQRVRCLFKYLWDADLIASPVKYGPSFKRPDKKARRRLRNQRGPVAFSADEIRRMLAVATPQMKAAILLGINCGFGNTDVATLPQDRIDLKAGWHSFGRPKTGVERRCPLWPETIAALCDVLDHRPEPRDEADESLVFLTRNGRPYIRLQAKVNVETEEEAVAEAEADEADETLKLTTWNDAISRETGKLLRKLGIWRKGLNFYALRRTFRTIADEAGDQPATLFIMGHADSDSDMSATYRQYISDERLRAVVEHVRCWLFPDKTAEADGNDVSAKS